MGWLTGWSKRQAITLTGGSDGAQTDFQLKLAIAYDSDMLSDFSDLRFTDADGNLIDAWLESKTDSTSADVWVEFPSTPANGETQTYYMYYGKSDAVDYWDIGETFVFGDDFESGTDGELPPGWTVNENVGTVRISTVTSNSGTKSTKIDDTGTQTAGLYGYVQLPSDMDAAVLEFAAKADADNYLAMGLDDSTFDTGTVGTDIPCCWLNYAANGWGYMSNDTKVYIEAMGTAWNTYSIKVDKTNYIDISKDGVNKATNQPLNFAPDLYRYLKMFILGGGATSHGYFDDVRVRKYAANPPTYEFGGEETESGGLSMAVVMHHLMQMRRS